MQLRVVPRGAPDPPSRRPQDLARRVEVAHPVEPHRLLPCPSGIDAGDDPVDDFLTIVKVEPGRLWFDDDVGPIDVPEEASRPAQVGWWVNLAAQRRAGTWFITETGYVYPRMIEDDENGAGADWGDLFPGTPSIN